MKKIGFLTNTGQDRELSFTKTLAEFVKSKGCEPVLYGEDSFYECDFHVVLGGDGTMLNAAITSANINPRPVLGINLGTLGYLTDVERTEAKIALEKAINGEYNLERRIMLELTVVNGTSQYEENKTFTALNEVCIKSSLTSKMSEICIKVNNEYIDIYRGDGIIICTPTGSTAYNLSAGGPILKPDGSMIAITPVCPHTLYARPIVISSEDVVTVNPAKPESELLVSTDGRNVCPITGKDTVYIKKSSNITVIMKTTKLGFYDILRLKMMGERKL